MSIAQDIRELEKLNPRKARKLMFEHPELLEARKQEALWRLKVNAGLATQEQEQYIQR